MRTIIYAFVLVVGVVTSTKAQLLSENFNYGTNADTLTNPSIGGNLWKRHSGTGSPLQYLTTSLSFINYKATANGGSVSFANGAGSREDANLALPNSINSGTVYTSFLFRVTNSGGTTPEYSIHLSDASGTSGVTSLRGRISLRDGATAGTFKIGISKSSAANSSTFSTNDFQVNRTYAVVLKYQFIAGTNNDSVHVYVIDSIFPTTEPSIATAVATDITQTDLNSIASFCIRQGTGGTSAAIIDGIMLSSNWNDFVPSGAQPPAPITALTFTGKTKSTADISFTKPTGYVDSSMSVLVFAKPNASINQGSPTFGVNAYTADGDIQSNNGTIYQNDTAARCVYKGDLAAFTLTGLTQGTTYHLLAFAVTDADSLYSTANTTSGQSSAQPAAPGQLQLTALSQTSIKLKFNRIAGYSDTAFTMLAWIKADSSITTTPILADGNYPANTDYAITTGRLENDSNARCVWNADGDSLTVTGLQAQTTYFVSVFTYRNADSTYSNGTSANTTTFGATPPPTAATNLRFQVPVQPTELTALWDKPVGYVDSTQTILVFAKAGSAINAGVNSKLPNTYTAASVFGNGSVYENDSQAFCIYNGDNNIVDLTGLSPQTTYYFNVWVVNDSVPTYSSAVTAFTQTAALPPPAVTNVLITGISETSVRINWTKPAGIPNSTHTTLVYLKQGAINTPITGVFASAVTASTVFGSGSSLPSDNLAYCVFKGDTTGVTVTGLSSQTAYEAIVFVQRDLDSSITANSTITRGNGSTQGPPQLYAIGQINTTNLTTGNPDSIGLRATVEGRVIGFNQRLSGLQFLVSDSTGGITAFNSSRNFGYTVREGNRVRLTGTVSTFRGLNQLVLDTVIVIDTTTSFLNATQKAVLLSEATENKLIWIDSLRLITNLPNDNWPTNSTNVLTLNTAGDTVVVRVLSTSPLAGKPIPTTNLFKVAGLGIQFSSSTAAPFPFIGYQMIPRGEFDITPIADPIDSIAAFGLQLPTNNDSIVLTNNNINDSILFNWQRAIPSIGLALPEYTLELDTVDDSFAAPLISISTTDTFTTITNANLVNLLTSIGVGQSQSYYGRWRVSAQSGSVTRVSTDTFAIAITNRLVNSLSELGTTQVVVYPNPAQTFVTVYGIAVKSLQVFDITGKRVAWGSNQQLSIEHVAPGVYTLTIETVQGSIARKLVIH
ncbi:MAG: T9SS type A sorting domain-containing protein [Bacteroidia bacterium]|jgi:hypothetical protein|nr:T9SS type A sorting domain-containing protein [Bacteroidia bacterium]